MSEEVFREEHELAYEQMKEEARQEEMQTGEPTSVEDEGIGSSN